MEWVYDDGGREVAGFKGKTGDCVCRAVAIAAERPYQEVYDLINEYAKSERTGKRKKGKSNARTGVYKGTMKKVLEHYGFQWMPTMTVGSGCQVHLKAEELPKGRIVCSCSRHAVAVVDGVIHDTYDGSRDESRCVYGYFYKPEGSKVKEKAKKENKPLEVDIKDQFAEFKKKIRPEDYPEAIKAINGLIEDFGRNAKNNYSLYELKQDKECYWRALVWEEAARIIKECVKDLEK